MRLLAIAILLGLFGCTERRSPENGVYVTPREVFGLQSEILELQNGKYRYWVLGDVGPRVPFERAGRYTVKTDRIHFDEGKDGPDDRLIISDDEMSRLLRDDAEEEWKKNGRLNPYGTLTKVSYSFEEMTPSTNSNREEWDALLPKLPTLGKTE